MVWRQREIVLESRKFFSFSENGRYIMLLRESGCIFIGKEDKAVFEN